MSVRRRSEPEVKGSDPRCFDSPETELDLILKSTNGVHFGMLLDMGRKGPDHFTSRYFRPRSLASRQGFGSVWIRSLGTK